MIVNAPLSPEDSAVPNNRLAHVQPSPPERVLVARRELLRVCSCGYIALASDLEYYTRADPCIITNLWHLCTEYYRVGNRAVMRDGKTTRSYGRSVLEAGDDHLASGDLTSLEPIEDLVDVREGFDRNHRFDDTLNR